MLNKTLSEQEQIILEQTAPELEPIKKFMDKNLIEKSFDLFNQHKNYLMTERLLMQV